MLALDRFCEHLPPKPYCTDDLTQGLKIRALKSAIEKSYIQPNGPGMVWVMVKDIDRAVIDPSDWWPVWETAGLGLPPPNMAVMNRKTGRGHLIYLLAAGVSKTSAARLAPLRYLSAVDLAYTG
ncbi:replication initiation protein [Acidithiobacillus sp. MC6.1]|nr:replication initiation protein [Acidithiobacillus sp. MC6.1]